jgi:ABC-2 type transport system ATP-binding protein
MIQQGPAGDFAELTVAEVVRHFAAYYPAPRNPDEVIAMVGLDEKAASRTRQLSGGQRRRLDVALGILGRPQLLFLDEPTTGFDPEARRQFWTLIRALRADGATILLTTHYLEEAEQLADRVAVIDGGRIRAVAPPATLGGRDQAPARVSWRDGAIHRTEATAQPTQLVQRLAERLGGEVPGLTVTRPSLEDIYLGLIGADNDGS